MTEQTEKKFTEALIEYAKGFGEWQYAMPCAKEGARLFVDSLWHPASEEPKDKAQCLVISRRKSKDVVTYSNQFFYKGHVIAYPCRLYALTDIIMWADMEDLLPDTKGDES